MEVRGGECRDGSVARSVWTCTATSARSRSVRTARCARRVGCRRRRRGSRRWRESLLALGPGGVGGDGQLLGGRPDPRAARQPGGRGLSPTTPGSRSARAKTDKLDARALASLLWRGELEAVWMPDERCRILRRRLARREQLVRSRIAGQERDPRRAAAPAAGQAAVLGPVRRQRSASGSRGWSCRSRSASRSTRRCATSSSSTRRSRRSRG